MLHASGANVSILDMNAEMGEAIVSALGSSRAHSYETDVTSSDSIASAVEGTVAWTKETNVPIGGVICAAGVGIPSKLLDRDGEAADMSLFDTVVNINLRGTIDLIRQCLPHLARAKPEQPDGERGVIIMVSSSAAFDGQPGQVAYSASKGAIASLTLPLTRDLARYGIRVVTVAPSMFETNMTAMMSDKARKSLERVMEFPVRPGKPEEFSRMVKEGMENSMLNGVVIRLDGGTRMPSKL